MIIVHLADLHLGYRAYTRTTANGVNQREADVSAAVARALAKAADLRPDLVVIAGDLFHNVRPSNAAIADAFRQLSGLVARLPGVPVVIVAGDRDTPGSRDGATILELFREIPGIFVATRQVERFRFDGLDAEVVAVPHAALASASPLHLAPTDAGHSVLVVHGAVTGTLPGGPLPGPFAEGGAALPFGRLQPERWSYVALGHHPVSAQLAANAWYAGSLERTSPEPWSEATKVKGFIHFDTSSETAEFHPVATRAMFDLPHVSARGRTPGEVSESIRAVVDGVPEGIDGAIVRLTITDIPRAEIRRLDPAVFRELRGAALHFVLDARPPQRSSETAMSLPVRGISLEAQVEEYLGRIWEPTMAGIGRDRLLELARKYLEEAEDGVER